MARLFAKKMGSWYLWNHNKPEADIQHIKGSEFVLIYSADARSRSAEEAFELG